MKWLIAMLLAFSTPAFASPLYQANDGGVTVVLHSDKCKIAAVSNLANRATWTEGAKTYEGCWGAHRSLPVIVLYFEDRTVVVLHQGLFRPLI